MRTEVKIPSLSDPVTPSSVLTLDQIVGLPSPCDRWKLVPPDMWVPAGIPVVRWYPHVKGLSGLRVQVLEKPLWSASIHPTLQNPEVVFVPEQDLHKLQEYPLPLPVPGKLVEVALVDTSLGVFARGAKWHFTPSTITEQYQEGTSYVCDDGREFVEFLREEVVWWGDLRLGGEPRYNPALKERIKNDSQL